MTPLVSVIIPTHTGGPHFLEALESLEAQTILDWEALVVGDGLALDARCLPTSPARTRVIEIPHSGVSVARNIAITASSAPWIALLDHDDLWLPTKLEVQCGLCEVDDDVGVCFTGAALLDAGRIRGHLAPTQVTYRSLLAERYALPASSLLLKRSVLDRCGVFDPLYPLVQDTDLVLRIARHHRVVGTTEALVYRRWHETNASHRYLAQHAEFREVLTKHLRLAQAEGEPDVVEAIRQGLRDYDRGFAASAYLRSAVAFHGREHRAAARHLLNAVRLSPGTTVRLVTDSIRRRIAPKNQARTQ
jgi:glycosyltransferase involved in cell wall biosynthesis